VDKQKTAFETALRRRGKPIDMRQLNRNCAWRLEMAQEHQNLAAQLRDSCTELSACPICGSCVFGTFVHVYEYPYAECAECGHIFMQTPPSEEALAALYSQQSGEKCPQRTVYLENGLFEQRVKAIALPKVEFCGEVIQPGGLWVDVGCGTGEVLTAARASGWAVSGIETDSDEVDFGRARGLDIRCLDALSLGPAEIGDAKVLSLLNLLEHLRDPCGLLCRLAEMLPTGACVVAETPRHPSLSSFVSCAFPHLAYRHIYPPEHLHVFTERSMEITLESAGLKPVAVWTFGQDFQDLVFASATNAGLDGSDFFDQIVQMSTVAQQSIDDSGFSDVLFVVAEKT